MKSKGIELVKQLLDTVITDAVFAHRSTWSAAPPGGVVFRRDMT